MNQQKKPELFVPALIGGAAAGFLSGIPLVGCLCCLWIIGGAMLAAHLAAKDYTLSMTAGDGAIVGALTGVIAAVVDALISLPLQALNMKLMQRLMERLAEYSSQLPGNWRDIMQRGMGETSLAWFLLGLVISAAIFAVLGALGGIIGASLFGKKSAPQSAAGGPDVPQDPSHR
jgi:hypothetical protein